MGEVHHADDAEHHRVADGDEAINGAERDAVDELLEEDFHALCAPQRGVPRSGTLVESVSGRLQTGNGGPRVPTKRRPAAGAIIRWGRRFSRVGGTMPVPRVTHPPARGAVGRVGERVCASRGRGASTGTVPAFSANFAPNPLTPLHRSQGL